MMRMALDETLRPIEMTCVNCDAKMTVYPDGTKGKGYCPNCSPAWLKSFAVFTMNQERTKRGLEPIEGEK